MTYTKEELRQILKLQYNHIREEETKDGKKLQAAYTFGMLEMYHIIFPDDPDGLTYHERATLRKESL